MKRTRIADIELFARRNGKRIKMCGHQIVMFARESEGINKNMNVVFVGFHHVNRKSRFGSYLGEQAFDFVINFFVSEYLPPIFDAKNEVYFSRYLLW